MGENKVIVTIFGDEYPVVGDSDQSHISKIADLVDSRMKEASNVSRINGKDKIAILAALSIASEMCEVQERLRVTEKRVDDRLDRLLEQLDSSLSQ